MLGYIVEKDIFRFETNKATMKKYKRSLVFFVMTVLFLDAFLINLAVGTFPTNQLYSYQQQNSLLVPLLFVLTLVFSNYFLVRKIILLVQLLKNKTVTFYRKHLVLTDSVVHIKDVRKFVLTTHIYRENLSSKRLVPRTHVAILGEDNELLGGLYVDMLNCQTHDLQFALRSMYPSLPIEEMISVDVKSKI